MLLDSFRMLVPIDVFWQSIGGLNSLGLLRSTCKSIRAETDPVLAVKAMGADRSVTKIWAQRWLGLSQSWMYIGAEMTLVRALELTVDKGRGGIAVTYKRGIEFRAKEEREKALKNGEKEAKQEREKDEHELKRIESEVRYNLLKAEFDIHLERSNIPREGWSYSNAVANLRYYEVKDVAGRAEMFKEEHDKRELMKRLRVERKAAFDERLTAAGLSCSGSFYDDCVHSFGTDELPAEGTGDERSRVVGLYRVGSREWYRFNGITDALIAEVRFRQQVDAHPDQPAIVNRLVHNRGTTNQGRHSYYGIETDIRDRFRKAYKVDADGTIRGCVRPLRALAKKD